MDVLIIVSCLRYGWIWIVKYIVKYLMNIVCTLLVVFKITTQHILFEMVEMRYLPLKTGEPV